MKTRWFVLKNIFQIICQKYYWAVLNNKRYYGVKNIRKMKYNSRYVTESFVDKDCVVKQLWLKPSIDGISASSLTVEAPGS